MILYHLDRHGSLQPNTPIDLIRSEELPENLKNSMFISQLKGGISRHGLNHLNLNCQTYPYEINIAGGISFNSATVAKQISIANMRILEFNVELVRRAYFPEYPSHLQSLFAVENIEDFRAWPELHTAKDGQTMHIFKIDTHAEVHRFDSTWLRGGLIFNTSAPNYYITYAPTFCFEFAFKYWSKIPSDHPRWEYLLPLPIDGSQVSLAAIHP